MPELLTVSEVASILRVDHTTIRRWCLIGALPFVALPAGNKGGKRIGYRIRKSDLDRVLTTRAVGGKR